MDRMRCMESQSWLRQRPTGSRNSQGGRGVWHRNAAAGIGLSRRGQRRRVHHRSTVSNRQVAARTTGAIRQPVGERSNARG